VGLPATGNFVTIPANVLQLIADTPWVSIRTGVVLFGVVVNPANQPEVTLGAGLGTVGVASPSVASGVLFKVDPSVTPVFGATVSLATGSGGGPATTDVGGRFSVAVTRGTAFSLQATGAAAGIEQSIAQERVTPLLEALTGGISFQAFPTGTLAGLAMAPPDGLGHASATMGAIAAGVEPVSGTTGVCADRSGWTITVTDAGGNAAGNRFYQDATGQADPALTATSSEGTAIFVNVPPGRVTITASKTGCRDVSPLFGLTGGFQSTANAIGSTGVLVSQ
jgi:hypothetical protein